MLEAYGPMPWLSARHIRPLFMMPGAVTSAGLLVGDRNIIVRWQNA
jgi:hypothetical protein